MGLGRPKKTNPQRKRFREKRFHAFGEVWGVSAVSRQERGYVVLYARVCVHVSSPKHGGRGGVFAFCWGGAQLAGWHRLPHLKSTPANHLKVVGGCCRRNGGVARSGSFLGWIWSSSDIPGCSEIVIEVL